MKQGGRVKRRCHCAFLYTRFSCNGENISVNVSVRSFTSIAITSQLTSPELLKPHDQSVT